MSRYTRICVVAVAVLFGVSIPLENIADACGVRLAIKQRNRGRKRLKANTQKRDVKATRGDSDKKRVTKTRGERTPVAVGPAVPEEPAPTDVAPAPTPAPAAQPAEPENPPVVAVAKVPEPEPEPVRKAKPAPKQPKVRTQPKPRPEVPAAAPAPPIRAEVYFDLGSSSVNGEASSNLGEVVQWLKDNPGARLVIEGHTDPTGSSAFNQRLSVLRARAVQRHLSKTAGTTAKRMRVRGFGEGQLAYGQDDERNRRVVVRSK